MNLRNLSKNDTIIAPATAPGMGAIAVIRISGPKAIAYTKQFFKPFNPKKNLALVKSHTAHFGEIVHGDDVLDEVLINVFYEGKSFTGEETTEISCHGSTYITQSIIKLFLDEGVRAADAGEFTMRAYRNGKFDLSQAEAVADLIHSTSKAGAQIALTQLKGGVSNQISDLRERLVNFASLIELELDFSEEDVEFADRSEFITLVKSIQNLVQKLMSSFALGNAIKNGIPVAIVGAPNVGKSTLLNALLGEDRAIVSDIAGTTRDVIEDELNIEGVSYRFIDTAGIRDTEDYVESRGIEKTFQKIESARVVLHLLSASDFTINGILPDDDNLREAVANFVKNAHEEYYAKFIDEKEVIFILNKVDLLHSTESNKVPTDSAKRAELNKMLSPKVEDFISNVNISSTNLNYKLLPLSAKSVAGVSAIKNALSDLIDLGQLSSGEVIISNARHYSSLKDANNSLTSVLNAMEQGIPADLLAIDIRGALHSLGEITGEITSDDLLKNIFGKFCIGK